MRYCLERGALCLGVVNAVGVSRLVLLGESSSYCSPRCRERPTRVCTSTPAPRSVLRRPRPTRRQYVALVMIAVQHFGRQHLKDGPTTADHRRPARHPGPDPQGPRHGQGPPDMAKDVLGGQKSLLIMGRGYQCRSAAHRGDVSSWVGRRHLPRGRSEYQGGVVHASEV